jgi:hypothetical protein
LGIASAVLVSSPLGFRRLQMLYPFLKFQHHLFQGIDFILHGLVETSSAWAGKANTPAIMVPQRNN